jgi:hypothetical protein
VAGGGEGTVAASTHSDLRKGKPMRALTSLRSNLVNGSNMCSHILVKGLQYAKSCIKCISSCQRKGPSVPLSSGAA